MTASNPALYQQDLRTLFGIELELGGDGSVPWALDLLDEVLHNAKDPDLRNLQTGLRKLRALDGLLAGYPAAALLRGFEIVGRDSGTVTAFKLGHLAAALRSFVRAEEATDVEVLNLWDAVVHAMQVDRADHVEDWRGSLEAWTKGRHRLRREFGRQKALEQVYAEVAAGLETNSSGTGASL